MGQHIFDRADCEHVNVNKQAFCGAETRGPSSMNHVSDHTVSFDCGIFFVLCPIQN